MEREGDERALMENPAEDGRRFLLGNLGDFFFLIEPASESSLVLDPLDNTGEYYNIIRVLSMYYCICSRVAYSSCAQEDLTSSWRRLA